MIPTLGAVLLGDFAALGVVWAVVRLVVFPRMDRKHAREMEELDRRR